jgi:tRNA 2-thiouridine synthesizing protein D
MKFMLAVLGDPLHCQGPITAFRFAEAALAAGHTIHRVFFYQGAVLVANNLTEPPQDETSINELWQHLASKNKIELVACIASASRRGIFDENEAARYEKPTSSISPGFIIGGLGQLMEGILVADKTITFGP